MELVLREARQEEADLVLAHDPDADRMVAAVRDAGGSYQVLSGDQIGCLLGYSLLDAYSASGELSAASFVVTTVVSSSQLARIAELFHVRCELTLTGLKWIWNRALELEERGGDFLFGYEEALGYSVGPAVRDKDGISAGLALAEVARSRAASGETLLDLLAEIEAKTGVVVTRQFSLPLPQAEGREQVRQLVDRLRVRPSELAGLRPRRLSDLERGERLDLRSGRSERLELPSSPVVLLELEEDRTVKLRPSGTEPKLKVYLEAREPPTSRQRWEAARQKAAAALDDAEQAVRALL